MLAAEKDTWYFVYPPGVEFSYRWEDLDIVLTQAVEVLSADPNFERWYRAQLDYPESFEPGQFMDGPFGGGVICVDLRPSEKNKWLPVQLLGKEADLMPPQAMLHQDSFPFDIRVLQPRNEPFMPRIKGSSRFSMLEGATAEHLASAKDDVYWLVTCTSGSISKRVKEQVMDTALGFNCEIEPLDMLPADVHEQAGPLFRRGAPHTVAFRLTRYPKCAGMNFAIMLYVGLLLRRKHGIRIRTMHLLASIEGAPTVWC